MISSSTSGYGMSEMAGQGAHAERPVVGHPFNPPYLIPLVEVVGGTATSPEVVQWTSDFFRHAGKSVITMDREVPGSSPTGSRRRCGARRCTWSPQARRRSRRSTCPSPTAPGCAGPIQGPMLTFHLAGGQGGMAHMLDHFGPSLLSPWTRLDAPELTPELRDAVVDGCEREADGRSIDDLVAERDRGVIAILRALGRA